MDPDHTPGQASEPSDPRAEHAAPARRRGGAPALDYADATEARLASRELDEGMPPSHGLDDDARVLREMRERFPSLPGAVLSEARASTVFLPYRFVFRRLIDLPALIVWDAVSDADMVSGWLAEASIEPEEGGEFWFEWMSAPDLSLATASGGIITRFDEGRCIEYTFVHEGEVTARFHLSLEEVPGGPRDRQTDLVVTVSGVLPAGIANVLKASWRLHLDLLEDLVHGRPVDWSTCEAEHGATWRRYLAELESAEG
ncbi:SRPBCC domain-containing protein [Clavibacter zhangzhiyongii]|uniref:SRPBCC domain-containing protein n=1 Tax=Clavibacter zhangzhiyongii TaxID=2768071 RepID=UPI00195E1F4F|nr:SRPBCC domain-containing protein [Clavibacter zhangzhiyongii]MBM7024702.1 SRPBCC domain-containing protein [Clavibacter zhangzhiyongii]